MVATPAGRPLYVAAGFEDAGDLELFGVPHSQMIIRKKPLADAAVV